MKIFYDQKWRAFEAPEHPPLYFHYYTVNGKTYETDQSAWKAYDEALALAKANALEVGNMDDLQASSIYFIKSEVAEKGECDWPGTAVIRDKKYFLEI